MWAAPKAEPAMFELLFVNAKLKVRKAKRPYCEESARQIPKLDRNVWLRMT